MAARKKAKKSRKKKNVEIGATGDYPEGRLNEEDEGGLQMAIGTSNGKVVIRFGKPVAWIGMSPEGADALAAHLSKRAAELRR